MCQEVFEIVQRMDIHDVDLQIALQCAPVIEGVKMSNLLIVPSKSEERVRLIFKHSGIGYFRLWVSEEKVAFLVYRRSRLEQYLGCCEVKEILREAGYMELSLGQILRRFRDRYERHTLRGGVFPHEMGLLLGYPVEDVRGFIENAGENYLYSGYWKVYCDVEQKKRIFDQYEQARESMIRQMAEKGNIRLILLGIAA